MSKSIADYMEKPTEKRDRSDDSTTGVSPEHKRTNQESEDDEGDVFTPPEDAPRWVGMLFKSMKKISNRMDGLYEKFDCYKNDVDAKLDTIRADTNAKINELTDTVKFLSAKHDEQLEINSGLENKLALIERHQQLVKQKILHHDKEMDALEQYGRRNCLVLHGVAESEGENTDAVFVDTVSSRIGVNIEQRDLDRSHRLGKPNADGRPRPIIAKFARYNVRSNVFANKKRLKGSNVMLTESLTRHRVIVFNEARNRYGNRNVWTADGEIYAKDKGKKERIDVF